MINYEPNDEKIEEDMMKLREFLTNCEIECLSIETDPSYCTILKWKNNIEESDGSDGFTSIMFEQIRKRFNFELISIFSDMTMVFSHEEARAMWQMRTPNYNA